MSGANALFPKSTLTVFARIAPGRSRYKPNAPKADALFRLGVSQQHWDDNTSEHIIGNKFMMRALHM